MQERFLSYLCPHCRQSVIGQRDLFAMAAAPVQIKCPCGHSELVVELRPDRVNLMVPCLFCGREHGVSFSSRAFVGERTLACTCAASGLTCCCVGEEGAVYAATARMEQAADKLSQAAPEQGEFLDPDVMEDILAELRDIAARQGISCTCGSQQCRVDVGYSAVHLVCTDCSATLRIPAATAEDITDLCCRTSLCIGGRQDV